MIYAVVGGLYILFIHTHSPRERGETGARENEREGEERREQDTCSYSFLLDESIHNSTASLPCSTHSVAIRCHIHRSEPQSLSPHHH